MSQPFIVKETKVKKVPIIISIPHVGTEIPEDLKSNYLENKIDRIDDTDWYLDNLYDFASDLGITIVKAKYSRWVIDLNRDPDSIPLYNDGRVITGLTTSTDFLGNDIYKKGKSPDEKEIERRKEKYYWPYYLKLTELLEERKAEFGNALLWDAHSIRESVPSIRVEKFPEMILGSADESSADKSLITSALSELANGYNIQHNDPFKGGHITRYFGKPKNHIHALQLERNKNLYMDDTEISYDPIRAAKMQVFLKRNLLNLIDKIKEL
ncbi:N-formylglutamate amidohydrolase [Crocinitomix catalasitica]|uniref:N-formylglutamate amidohydrolase n=1 Tax=Crocinitomix catalasitica TaxID=184607 RepID=UPI000685C5D3|nr:N-formylglutamate amidohydrolase [Crocinitomix catalasitica]